MKERGKVRCQLISFTAWDTLSLYHRTHPSTLLNEEQIKDFLRKPRERGWKSPEFVEKELSKKCTAVKRKNICLCFSTHKVSRNYQEKLMPLFVTVIGTCMEEVKG